MARRGKPSIVREVSKAISAVNMVGTSKRTARKMEASGIHSIKQIQESLSAAQNFIKWVRADFSVRSIYDLTEEHYRSYLDFLSRAGRSAGHRQNVETSLKHLQKGMNVLSDQHQRERVIFTPEHRLTSWRELNIPVNRSYTLEEYERILPYLSEEVTKAVKLMRHMGLRVREACQVKVEYFNSSYMEITSDQANGVTKGGRPRTTPIPADFKQQLEMFKEAAAATGRSRIVGVKQDSVRKALNRAYKKAGIQQSGRGTHGFRHLYCRERLSQLLKEKGILAEGLYLLNRIMENRSKGRKADYSILSDKDKEDYVKLKYCVDQIHSEIGHGEDRWDLAERYMWEGVNDD